MTEAELQTSIIDLAHLLHWRVAHFRTVRVQRHGRTYYETPVQADGAGFPDLVLVHPKHGVLYAELKTDRGRLSAAQNEWIAALLDAGAHVAVFLERDWHAGTVEKVLRGGP